MAHVAQKEWCKRLKEQYPQYFSRKRVLDVGALDINGNNRELFNKCDYVGLDVIEGKNIDVVSIAHEYQPEELFDVVLSTNALEHDMYFKLTLNKMTELLKPEGFMFFSVANNWPEHGTLKKQAAASGTSSKGKEWGSYYRNLNIEDVTQNLHLNEVFIEFYIGLAGMARRKDLRFWGIKR